MLTQESAIIIERLQKSYGTVQAVKGISLRVQQGEIFGFLGPNGAGKTTTIRCMLDVIRPSAGTIRVLGWDAQRDTLTMHQHIGYLPGDVRLPGQLTGKQLIDYFAHLQGREPVLLHDLVSRFDVETKRPLKSYSKGMRQKIGIVLAFMCDPEVLILDEPTSGLDPLMRKIFNELLLDEQARGKTIFLSSHVLSEVEKVCQRVAIIREGELVTVEAVEALRQKAGQLVIVEFGDTVTSEELERIPGVSDVKESNGSYQLHVSGSMSSLVKALGRHEVSRLLVEEAPLEDVFLKFYEGSEQVASVTY
jgi:beta-exotoxin I transport system ATP-binding protein